MTRERYLLKIVTLGMVFCLLASVAGARDESFNMDLLPVQTFGGELTAAVPVFLADVTIDCNALIAVSAISLTLDPVLISPSGERFPFGDPLRNGVESVAVPDLAEPGITGTNYWFVLEGAEVGTWQFEVSEQVSVTDPVQLFFNLMFESPRGAAMLGAGEVYPMGTTINLGFVVSDGSALMTGAAIGAQLFKLNSPGFSETDISFLDPENDGIYTAGYTPTQPGAYQINVRADVDQSGALFSRTAAGRFLVVASAGTIDGNFDDRGIDDDGDARLDGIGISPWLTADQAGTYVVTVMLTKPDGSQMQNSRIVDLLAGSSAPEVRFEAADVARDLGDGPYDLSVVRLELQGADGAVVQDEKYDLGATAAYSTGDFVRNAILLVGSPTAFGTDYNANGLFDLLTVNLNLDLLVAGTFRWSARLVDPLGNEIGFDTGAAFFPVGGNTIALDFAGQTIGENGVDGPYEVRSLILYGAGESLIANSAGATPMLLASQFEGFVNADVTPPTLEVVLSPDVLWPPTHKMMEITPTIAVVDDFDPSPVVVLESIVSNEGDDMIGDGHTTDDIQVDEQGRIFVRSERSGLFSSRVYTLTFSATDAAGNSATKTATVTVPHDKGKPDMHRNKSGSILPALAVAIVQPLEVRHGDLKTVRWNAVRTVGEVSVDIQIQDLDSGEKTLVAAGIRQREWHTWPVEDLGAATYRVWVTIHDDRENIAAEVMAGTYHLKDRDAQSLPGNKSVVMRGPFPNPFNPRTTFELALPADAQVSFNLYDVSGRLVRTLVNRRVSAGELSIVWEGNNDKGRRVPSGVYFSRLVVDGKLIESALNQLVLLK